MSYTYKIGTCVHCGRSLICGKGVAHFKCSYKAQEEVVRLYRMANFYRQKCKILGGALEADGAVPSDSDLALLKQLEEIISDESK